MVMSDYYESTNQKRFAAGEEENMADPQHAPAHMAGAVLHFNEHLDITAAGKRMSGSEPATICSHWHCFR
jgi:hypothetical protein